MLGRHDIGLITLRCGFESRNARHGRLSRLGLGLLRTQNDPKGLRFDSSAFHQLMGLLKPGFHCIAVMGSTPNSPPN